VVHFYWLVAWGFSDGFSLVFECDHNWFTIWHVDIEQYPQDSFSSTTKERTYCYKFRRKDQNI